MNIQLKRAYDEVGDNDGYRVLVDRIWPRGVRKKDLKLDEWCKAIAPSEELRVWFDHDPEKFISFKKRYLKELNKQKVETNRLVKIAGQRTLTLIYGAKDREHNHAIVLKEHLENN